MRLVMLCDGQRGLVKRKEEELLKSAGLAVFTLTDVILVCHTETHDEAEGVGVVFTRHMLSKRKEAKRSAFV